MQVWGRKVHIYFIKSYFITWGKPNDKFRSLIQIIFYLSADVLLNYRDHLMNSFNDYIHNHLKSNDVYDKESNLELSYPLRSNAGSVLRFMIEEKENSGKEKPTSFPARGL